MGRLDDLRKKHSEEIYTKDSLFIKLTPRKTKGKQPEAPDDKEASGSAEKDADDADSMTQ